MARGKNTPALFEVIRNAQQKQKEQLERQKRQQEAAEARGGVSPAAALLQSTTYWFKGKQAHEAENGTTVAEPVVEKPVDRTPIETVAKAEIPVFREIPKPKPVAVVPVTAVVEPVKPVPAVESPAAAAARAVREELAATAAQPMFARPSDRTPFDHDEEDSVDEAELSKIGTPAYNFQFKFNTQTAVVAGFAILVAFSVAYVIGTAGRGNRVEASSTKVNPNVLNVQPQQTPANPTPVKPNVAPSTDDGTLARVPTNSADLALDTIGKPVAVPINVKRVIGHQYLVLLSFPQREDAQDLVKFMAQNGVPATAETALPGYAKSWTSVVTVRGFERTKNNPAYTAYSNAVRDLLQKYSGNDKFRKTFKLDVYTWRTAR